MERKEYPLVHIYAQSSPCAPVRIIANTEGLLMLATTIIEATSTVGEGISSLFCTDGEAFEINVVRDDSDEVWIILELPYSD